MATVNYTDPDSKNNVQAALEDATGVSIDDGGNLSGLATGQDTVATTGTAVQLNDGTSLTVPSNASLRVKGLSSNGGIVYVGDDTVAAGNGYELGAGESVVLSVDDVTAVWIDAGTAGDGVSWIVEQ